MRNDLKEINESIQGLRDSKKDVYSRLSRLEEYVSTLGEIPKRDFPKSIEGVYQCVGCCARLKVTFVDETGKDVMCCFCGTWQRVSAPDRQLPQAGRFPNY